MVHECTDGNRCNNPRRARVFGSLYIAGSSLKLYELLNIAVFLRVIVGQQDNCV